MKLTMFQRKTSPFCYTSVGSDASLSYRCLSSSGWSFSSDLWCPAADIFSQRPIGCSLLFFFFFADPLETVAYEEPHSELTYFCILAPLWTLTTHLGTYVSPPHEVLISFLHWEEVPHSCCRWTKSRRERVRLQYMKLDAAATEVSMPWPVGIQHILEGFTSCCYGLVT